jgi:flagellar basal body rod protein FlgB
LFDNSIPTAAISFLLHPIGLAKSSRQQKTAISRETKKNFAARMASGQFLHAADGIGISKTPRRAGNGQEDNSRQHRTDGNGVRITNQKWNFIEN